MHEASNRATDAVSSQEAEEAVNWRFMVRRELVELIAMGTR